MRSGWNKPEELRRLPFDLLRAQNYPLQPHLVMGAILQMMEPGYHPPQQLLPQRMGFRHDASGVTSAVRAVEAFAGSPGGSARASAPTAPALSITGAARARFDHLPRATDKITEAQIPGVPELPKKIDRVPPFMLDDLSRAQSTFAAAVDSARFGARVAAMSQIDTVRSVIRRFIGR